MWQLKFSSCLRNFRVVLNVPSYILYAEPYIKWLHFGLNIVLEE
jgi:hypothetical protein